MLNQSIIIGRIVKNPELLETESGKKYTNITLAVSRNYKNIDGEYETDFIPCKLWQGIAENTVTYCKVGDLIGIKGRLETDSYEKEERMHYVMNLVAEKVTFLSSGNKKKTDE